MNVQRALDYVRAPDTPEAEQEVVRLLALAGAVVRQYLGAGVVIEPPTDETLLDPDADSVYLAHEAVVLLVFGELYANREASTANVLSPTVQALLQMLRGPVHA